MAYNKNVSVLANNRLSLSGSSITLTGSLFGTTVSGTVGQFSSLSASSVRINNVYTLPTSDGTTGQVISTNGSGQLTFTTISAGSEPGGPDTSVQFNSGSTLSGSSNLTYDYTTGVLSGTLSSFTQVSASYIDLGYPSEITEHEQGRLYYDDSNNKLKVQTEISSSAEGITEITLGQQLVVRVKNVSGVELAKGKVVHITGSSASDTPRVTTASYESDSVSADTLGVLMNTVANNDDGYAILYGVLTGIDLSSYSVGDMLYLSSSGDFTTTVPQSPLHEVRIGQITRAQNNGAMFVRIQNGYETDELHDVLFSNKAEGDLISWDATTGVWRNKKQLTGSYEITGDITASNGQFTAITADTITAREYYTELVTASVIYQSGSTKFGDTAGGAQEDTHQFSGSLYITGSTVTLTGGSFSGNGSGLTNIAAGQLQGTIPSSVLQNSSLYIGTTQIALNRSSAIQTLSGVSIDGNSATATTALTASSVQMELDYTATTAKYLTFLDAYNPSSGTGQKIKTGYLLYYIPNTNTLYSNFSGPLTGNASSATYASNVSITEVTSNGSYYVPFMGGYTTTTSRALYGDSGIYYNPSSNTLTVGTLVETSTRDIKENIKTIPNQLKNIKKLNPVQYNKIDSKRQEIGLIAEEVEKVYPEFVHEKGINYPKMVSILISAVQELTEKVEQQQKEIENIKSKKNTKKTEKTLKEKSTAKNTIVLGS